MIDIDGDEMEGGDGETGDDGWQMGDGETGDDGKEKMEILSPLP